MPSTRRRFLSGAAAGVALLAGCNEPASSDVDHTVTPVDVPRTDAELLQQAASIAYPSLPAAVVVTDVHFEAALGHAESLLSALEGELESGADVDLSESPRPVSSATSGSDRVVQRTRQRLESYREREPSLDTLADLERALGETALLLGYVRAERGETTLEDVEAAIDAERRAVRSLRSSIEYRLSSPVAESLPTLHVAESKLDSARRLRFALESTEKTETEEPTSVQVGQLRRQLARHRRRRRDAERFLERSTGSDEPSRADRLSRELLAVRDELESLPDRFQPDPGGPEPTTVAGQFRSRRRHVGRRADRWLGRHVTDGEGGQLVRRLLEGTRILVQVDAMDAAVERTTDRLDGRTFPARRVPDEKRRAVENVEAAVDGTALQRFLAEQAVDILDFAGHHRGEDGVSVSTVSETFFLYALAADWCVSSTERGRTLAESLT